ncbi:MAG: conjugative transposon protein TraN [Williamsia sp.]|nr:conjugative transposon protein TraN [Williamsia sp.]
MKKVSITLAAALFLIWISGVAQVKDTIKGSVISSYRLLVTTGKTTNLVFPHAIKSADRGSSDVIAQQVKGVENILQVKAGVRNFPETNLTVITADGSLYSFLVSYSANPSDLNIHLSRDTVKEETHHDKDPGSLPVSFTDAKNNIAEVERAAALLSNKRTRTIHGVKDSKYAIRVRLISIYVKENVLYFQLQLCNVSNLNYDVDMIRFYIQDDKRTKRSAIQILEIMPICITGNPTLISAHSKGMYVFAFDKFTIADKKHLVCEIREKNGGRNLSIQVRNKHIIHARMIRSTK